MVVAQTGGARIRSAVKLVKHQINGNERIVLKEGATLADLRAEAERLKTIFGYNVQIDERLGRYTASHGFYRGKFVLTLEPD